MDTEDKEDTMHVNLSNVFSPHRSTHIQESAHDMDFTEYGNPLFETDEESSTSDSNESDNTNKKK
jgi:hypothetical protein